MNPDPKLSVVVGAAKMMMEESKLEVERDEILYRTQDGYSRFPSLH